MTDTYRDLFEVPSDVAYFNSAALGPRLRAVSAAGAAALDRTARPWQTVGADWFDPPERLRAAIARLIEAPAEAIALVPSASYGIAIAAANIRVERHQNIVVLEEQFPSNIYAWRRKAAETNADLRVARKSTSKVLTESVLERIDGATALVAVPNCHWTDGELVDLPAVAAAARAVGAALVVDASQSLGVFPLDMATVDPDFLVAVGYKWLLGPFALGYLYASDRFQKSGHPIEESWLTRAGSEDFSRLVDYVDKYRPGARRFDMGEFPQFVAVPMAIAAVEQMGAWGVETIQSELRARTNAIRAVCDELGLAALPASRTVDHIVGIPMPNGEAANAVAARLKASDVYVSRRGLSIRVSPHLHVTTNDTIQFAEALSAAFKAAS